MNSPHYASALKRNINEVFRAIFEHTALIALEKADTYHGIDFIRLSYDALFNDMIAHTIKVLESSSDARSFWWIKKQKELEVDQFAQKNKIDLTQIEAIALQVKLVRDKTHFHIDSASLGNPKQIWDDAGIKDGKLREVLNNLRSILEYLYNLEIGKPFRLREYSGEDAIKIAQYAESLRD